MLSFHTFNYKRMLLTFRRSLKTFYASHTLAPRFNRDTDSNSFDAERLRLNALSRPGRWAHIQLYYSTKPTKPHSRVFVVSINPGAYYANEQTNNFHIFLPLWMNTNPTFYNRTHLIRSEEYARCGMRNWMSVRVKLGAWKPSKNDSNLHDNLITERRQQSKI